MQLGIVRFRDEPDTFILEVIKFRVEQDGFFCSNLLTFSSGPQGTLHGSPLEEEFATWRTPPQMHTGN